ncbi:MAG: tyrosine-type recombinase/integrase [Planctomycetes bacterium]|nr:tyrosine-type recombinase/integrase [Planctomycetota bacterium]
MTEVRLPPYLAKTSIPLLIVWRRVGAKSLHRKLPPASEGQRATRVVLQGGTVMGRVYQRPGREGWYIDYVTLDGRRVRQFGGMVKRLAEAQLYRAEDQKIRGALGLPVEDMQIDELFKKLLEQSKTTNAPSRTARVKHAFDHFRQFLAEHHKSLTRANQFVSNPHVFVEYQQARLEGTAYTGCRKVRRNTCNLEIKTLATWLRRAAEQKLISSNPVKIRALRTIDSRKREAPTIEHVRTIIKATKDSWLHVPVLLAASVGLRRAEVVHLQWSDFDRKRCTLEIRNKPGVFTPKSCGAADIRERTVHLPPTIAKALENARGNDGENDWIVPHPSRDELARRITCDYANLARSIGVPRNASCFHALRHFTVSHWLSLGIPPQVVMAQVGHHSPAILMRYTHVSDDLRRQAALKADGI